MAAYDSLFEDILEPRRHSSDLRFATQSRQNVPEYKYLTEQTRPEVINDVLQSQRIKHTIEQVSKENGVATEELSKEASSILQEMAHNFKMSNIRVLGYLFPKIYRNLYQHIYVNRAGIEKLRKTMKETPVVLLPSHRSYNDFLLMSYILFHYNLPLPRIAAGADFQAMKFVSNILRWAGAFYIRRSFGSDKLYWAVFTEYVQRLLVNGEAPVEFFLEGTRSRTGKSLPPKLGLLSVVLEPFLKGKVSDISLIPIGVSYERILEEVLYAREMLGIPKPKESTSGLIKARSIFEDDYGSIYINFGDPISIRTLCEGHVDRSAYSLSPRFLFSLTKPDQKFIFELAYAVLLQQQKTLVISPWILIASILLQSPQGIPLEYLCRQVEWLKDVVVNLGGNVKWPGSNSLLSVVKSSLAVHHTAASLKKDNRVCINSASTWTAPGAAQPAIAMTKEEVMTIATTHILLGSYRNQLTPMLKQAAMIALTFSNQQSLDKGILLSRYRFLVSLMSREFIFHPRTSDQEFDAILRKLDASYFVLFSGEDVSLTSHGATLVQFLQKMFHPFVLGYWFVCQYLLSLHPDDEIMASNVLAREIQDVVASRIAEGDLFEYDMLSLNILDNAVKTCIQLGGLVNNKVGKKKLLTTDQLVLNRIAESIAEMIQVPHPLQEKPITNGKLVHAAKL